MSDTGGDRSKVAIIGGGISGLSTAFHLINCSNKKYHELQLFEASEKLGGHAYTLDVDVDGSPVPVDIGFMVFNDANYPNLIQFFEALGVKSEKSDMSLSVSLDNGRTVEWCSDGLAGLLANPKQLLDPKFYSFLKDLIKFNDNAADFLSLHTSDPRRQMTVGQYLRQEGYSDAFCSYYLMPMTAALWSSSKEEVLQFPAYQLISFLNNHQMLQLFNRPEWKTVHQRSQTYTSAMADLLGDRVHLSTPIQQVVLLDNGQYELFTSGNKFVGFFDKVVFACHPPTAASMLSMNNNKYQDELIDLLRMIEYSDNEIYVHSDERLMPKSQTAWASWNCLGKSVLLNSSLQSSNNGSNTESFEGGSSGFGNKLVDVEKHKTYDEDGNERMKAVYVTYWLNRLQNLKTDANIFVSLNPHVLPDKSKTHKKVVMAHPQFNPKTVLARESLQERYQGKNGLYFCGAWAGFGFHEDGCRAGFDVATSITGTPLPWVASDREDGRLTLPPPDLAHVTIAASNKQRKGGSIFASLYTFFSKTVPIAFCRRFVLSFLRSAITTGKMELVENDGTVISFGNGSACRGCDRSPVRCRIFDPWFYVKIALEYDLGLARSYMAGYFNIEPLSSPSLYDPVVRPPDAVEESNIVLGDPIGLFRLFMLFIGNRDDKANFAPRKSAKGYSYSNAFTNASGLIISKVGSFMNFLKYKLLMNNSENGGSLKNIHAHYDLSNDLFRLFLDDETMMYSSAIYDAIVAPKTLDNPNNKLIFRGTLEEAEWRKLDTLLDRAQVRPGQKLLDIGFGWGGLSLHAAKKYGCEVVGITLSVEQKALAEERVRKEGLDDFITFEVVDYRTFARRRENQGKFDRVISCEMIEAVGHEHLGEFFWAVEQVLSYDGILVMEAITTPESSYETYLRSTDFINTIIFPGSLCPSLHALVDAAYNQSTLTLEHIDNIGLHYAETLAEWRRRFNKKVDTVRKLGFDDVFLRVWNYYLTYCQAGFHSQTENCLILVFSRQGCSSLVPLCETRSVTQLPPFTDDEAKSWIGDETAQ